MNDCPRGEVMFKRKCCQLHEEYGCEEYKAFIGREVFLVPDPVTTNLICADENHNYKCTGSCCVGKKPFPKKCRKGRKGKRVLHQNKSLADKKPNSNLH